MKITVAGGGNIGTQFAAHCANKGHEVTIYTSRPSDFSSHVAVVNRQGDIIAEGNVTITDRLEDAVKETDLLFVATPAFMADSIANKITGNIKKDAKICLVPGTGGMECAFIKALDRGCVIFGLQRVPAVVRTLQYGHTVCATGYRELLHAAAIPSSRTEECARIIQGIFDIECATIENYLGVTLTPSNPILHPSRLYTMFKDYKPGDVYQRNPLFYEEWEDESSQLLFAMDEEEQNICAALSEFDLTCVRSLKLHYESDTPQKLTQKIRSIAGFKGIYTPMVQVENGFVPDFNSRFFTADFPFGLKILLQVAQFAGVEAPNMSKVYEWYTEFAVSTAAFSYQSYGISNKKQFLKFYLQ